MLDATEEYIDITPTWESAVRIYLEVWEDLSDAGKRGAQEELLRCAKMADKYMATQGQAVQKILGADPVDRDFGI